jgi:glycosyltransferase involved in cell wall biosynthesis
MACSLAVLITYYNEKELLTECLNSIFAQTVPVDQIIIYDDASSFPATDYIPPGFPVRVIRGEENGGPGFGRNELLKTTKCEYVHFQDADDLFHSDWCRQVKESIAKTQADVVLTEISSYKEGSLVCEKVMGLDRLSEISDLIKFALMGSILVPSTTFRRDIALSSGGYRTKDILPQSEDFDFHVRLAATGATYAIINKPLIIQRLRENSHSQNTKLCYTSAIKSITLLSEELSTEYHNDLAEASARIGSVLYKMGAKSEAKEAFILANQLGQPYFLFQGKIYRMIARRLGQNYAEISSSIYRKILPKYLRKFIRGNS